MMTLLRVCLLVCVPAHAFALGSDQLYTGTPSTIPPGKTQALAFTDHTHPTRARLGGIQVRPGVTSNVDAKIAYSYLWNSSGPNAQFGPNVGLKWRFAGNGLTNPSLAISALCAINAGVGDRPHKSDVGATLIGSYPTKHVELLANFGHVWVGDSVPDLRFVSFAVVRPVARRTLIALEYSSIKRLGNGGAPTPGRQVAAAIVYGERLGWTYSAEVGYLPDAERVRWHTTLGIGVVF
jgi:hypothetical protein